MRGRKPRPTHLKLLEGNPGKRAINRNEPKPSGILFDPPSDLPAKAIPFWNKAIATNPRGLLKTSDERLLFAWSVAAQLHSEAATMIAQTGTIVKSASTGEVYQHPSLSIMNRQAVEMRTAGAELGFSPTSRTRIAMTPSEGGDNDFSEFA